MWIVLGNRLFKDNCIEKTQLVLGNGHFKDKGPQNIWLVLENRLFKDNCTQNHDLSLKLSFYGDHPSS